MVVRAFCVSGLRFVSRRWVSTAGYGSAGRMATVAIALSVVRNVALAQLSSATALELR